jgi:outer membrane biosynthesis protein TonB
MNNSFAFEDKNRNKGKRISFIIHVLILLIAFFYYLPQVELDVEDEKPPYAVKVDFTFEESSLSKFAHEDEGAQRAKSESAPEETPEQPTQEQATQPEVIETTQPQVIDVPKPDIKMPTPVVTKDEVIETKTPIEESPVKVVEKPKAPTSKPVPTKPSSSPSTSSTSGSTTGTSTSKPSTVNGKEGGTGKGNTGTGAGKDKGDDGDAGVGNNTSDGTGAYDGSGDGVFGRKIVYRDKSAAKEATTVSGKVSVKVCINRAGTVTYVELNNAETTIRDKITLKKYLKAAYGYKFQPDLSAPKEQCGKMSFKIDNSINNKLR